MSLNHSLTTSALLLMLGCSSSQAPVPERTSASVCPEINGRKLARTQLYDGQVIEQAILAPDEADPKVYDVGAIYERGRQLTIRCEYEPSFVVDVSIVTRVKSCKVNESENRATTLSCE
jgi:hypothetical protein